MNLRGASSSSAPDLDWSQLRETVRMLSLSVAQIETVMKDGDESVDTLANSVIAMADEMVTIRGILERLDGHGHDAERVQAIERCRNIDSSMSEVVVSLQFYDRLRQRLSHVGSSLEQLTELVSDFKRLYNPGEWNQLQNGIRSRYTMERDKAMFDALMAGRSVQEALDVWRDHGTENGDSGDVELF